MKQALVGLLLVAACGESATAPQVVMDEGGSDSSFVQLTAVGDVHAKCTVGHPSGRTGDLAASDSGQVIAVGDNAGINGSAAEYQCFHRQWGGKLAGRLWLAMGNHEHRLDPLATGYYDYAASQGIDVGSRGEGWYVRQLGSWRVYVVNSEASITAQVEWLKADLAANPSLCQMAVWHKPAFTTGTSVAAAVKMRAVWRVLNAAGVDAIVNAHDHTVQVTKRLRWDGIVDSLGAREFVIGTGGGVKGTLPVTLSAATDTALVGVFGVMRFKLFADRWQWEFVDLNNNVRINGEDVCR